MEPDQSRMGRAHSGVSSILFGGMTEETRRAPALTQIIPSFLRVRGLQSWRQGLREKTP
jgi:hypothetical protein